jgi:hypothetical protein
MIARKSISSSFGPFSTSQLGAGDCEPLGDMAIHSSCRRSGQLKGCMKDEIGVNRYIPQQADASKERQIRNYFP